MWNRDLAPGNPLNAEAVGEGRMHWPTRDATFAFRFFFSEQRRIETPSRPSGVSPAERYPSIPASQGHPILEVANPVASTAALYAHSLLAAVMTTLAIQTGKASA